MQVGHWPQPAAARLPHALSSAPLPGRVSISLRKQGRN